MIIARAICAMTTVIAGALIIKGVQTSELQLALSEAQTIVLIGIALFLALADRRNL